MSRVEGTRNTQSDDDGLSPICRSVEQHHSSTITQLVRDGEFADRPLSSVVRLLCPEKIGRMAHILANWLRLWTKGAVVSLGRMNMSVGKSKCAALIIGLMLVSIVPAFSKGEVTLDRILLQHTMHVVSTEQASALSKYVFDLKLRDTSVLTPTDLIVKAKGLGNEEGVFFIMDRSKAKHLSAEEEALLPCPTSAIAANQVILYSRKAKGRNAWEILVSAPNEKWLNWELNRICNSSLRQVTLDERGSIIDRYLIKRLLVVSTEGQETANAWIKGQTQPGGDAIDWDFVRADAWNPDGNSGVDTVFLLDRQKMGDNCPKVVASLPKDLQTWLGSDGAKTGIAAAKETIQGDQTCSIQGIIAPSTRHLSSALTKYHSLDQIPGSLDEQRLHDLSGYGQIVIVVRSGDRSGENSVINDFGGKLNSALSAANLGFTGVSRQDLKELIFAVGDGDKIDSTQLLQIRKKIGKACALAIADLTAVDTKTSYVANSPACETSKYPAFRTSEPSKPSKPDSNESILFKGKKYRLVDGSRENDPAYIHDLENFRHKLLPEFERAYRKWERDKEDYEDSRRSHDMEWSRSVDAVQSVTVAGNLRIYDAGDLGTDTAGQLVFSCSLSGSEERRNAFRSDKVSVRGEDSRPDALDAPESRTGVDDLSAISKALEDACNGAMGQLQATAILPSDMVNYAPAAGQVAKPEVKIEHVAVEAVGSTKLNSMPKGAALETARQAALLDSYPRLISNIALACPGATVTEDEVKSGAKIISEGYNPQTHEYRVKAHFEGDVAAEQPKAEVMR